jgi:DNA-binding MarR family transcriptional regulator
MTVPCRDALNLWRGALVETLRREGLDLSSRQMAVLLTVYLTPMPHTVRGLAARLGVSKPAITRAVDRLTRLGLLRRREDPADGRSVLIQRTVHGSIFLSQFGDRIARAAEEATRA